MTLAEIIEGMIQQSQLSVWKNIREMVCLHSFFDLFPNLVHWYDLFDLISAYCADILLLPAWTACFFPKTHDCVAFGAHFYSHHIPSGNELFLFYKRWMIFVLKIIPEISEDDFCTLLMFFDIF